jgi:hypothetical protein
MFIAPYQGVERWDPPRQARWSAAAIFEIVEEKVNSFTKDWDQKVVQVNGPICANMMLRVWGGEANGPVTARDSKLRQHTAQILV